MKKRNWHLPCLLFAILALSSCRSKERLTNLSSDSQHSVDSSSKSSSVVTKYNVSLFVENSESMDGYVNPSSKFELALHSLLREFKNSGIADTISLNYVNSSIKAHSKNANDDSIDKFISILSKHEFQDRRHQMPPPYESEFYEMFGKILNQYQTNSVIVFVSDFIYYPTHFAKDYCVDTNLLEQQSTGIKRVFKKLNQPNFSAIVLQMVSDFKGTYFDKCNNGFTCPCTQRPYYIWIMGDHDAIQKIAAAKIIENIPNGNVENTSTFQTVVHPYEFDYDVMPASGPGTYRFSGNATTAISDATTTARDNNIFEFTVEINVPKNLFNSTLFLDTSNYKVQGGNFHLTKVEKVESKDDNLNKYQLVLRTNTLIDDTVRVELLGNKIPEWATAITSTDDHNLSPSECKKTFGFSYILKGLSSSFEYSSPVMSIKVPVALKHKHLGAGFIVFLVGAMIALIFFIIRKNSKK